MAAEIYACLKTIQSCVLNRIILHYSCHLTYTDRQITVLIDITPDKIECLWDDLVCIAYGLEPIILQRDITESNYFKLISELLFVFQTRTREDDARAAAVFTYKPLYPLDVRFTITEDRDPYTFPKIANEEDLPTFVEALNELRCLIDLFEMPYDEIKYKIHKKCVSLVWSRKDAQWGAH